MRPISAAIGSASLTIGSTLQRGGVRHSAHDEERQWRVSITDLHCLTDTLLQEDGKRLAGSPPAGQDSQYHFGTTVVADERVLLVAYYENAAPPPSVVALSVDTAQPLAASPAPATEGMLPTYASRSYRFTGSMGQAVTLQLTRGYPYSQMDMRLYNPEGQRIAIPVGSRAVSYLIETTLPSSGEYWVELIRGQPISGDAGAYTLTLAM